MPEKLTKHTLHLIEGDYKKLQEAFPQHGAAVVVRKLVHKYIARLEAQIAAKLHHAHSETEVDIDNV